MTEREEEKIYREQGKAWFRAANRYLDQGEGRLAERCFEKAVYCHRKAVEARNW